MIVEQLTRPGVREPFLKVLEGQDRNGQNGAAGEDRLLMSGVSWEEYLELDELLGHDRPVPRLYFLEGELEIMSTSLKHEELKKWLAMMVEDYLYETGIETFPHGQATMKILKQVCAEPDESWCFDEQKQFPELVLEIALTSGGLPKLEIYQRFG